MKNNLFIALLPFISLLAGCPQQSQTTPQGDGQTLASDELPYTFVVGVPYVTGGATSAPLYDGLVTNLAKNVFNVNRLLLSTESPSDNAIYAIGASIESSGIAVQFIATLAKQNNLELYSFADVEPTSGWPNWTPNSTIQVCQNSTSPSYSADQQSVLKSICWAAMVNQLIGKNVVSGVAYDGQSFVLPDTDDNRAWINQQTNANKLRLGWVSSGLKSSVDLNLVEVYDLSKGANGSLRIDTVAPESVYKVVQGITPVCAAGICSYTGDFPGPQFETTGNIGAVGANIYQCAIGSSDSANACDKTYTTNVDTTQPPHIQMLQSLEYIFNQTVKTALNSNVYGSVPSPAPANNSVVYLLSTQYIGPMQSYAKSGQQCADAAGNCACIASLYDPTASCGDENGFGSWGNNLNAFQSFASQFMASQGCAFPGGCNPGVYMYDFIPQKWFQ